jgi:hypothetical protein
MWVDADYRRSMRSLRIRAASEAWLELLRRRPALRRALALGNRVAVALDEHRAVIVDPGAPAGVTPEQVRSFLGAD